VPTQREGIGQKYIFYQIIDLVSFVGGASETWYYHTSSMKSYLLLPTLL